MRQLRGSFADGRERFASPQGRRGGYRRPTAPPPPPPCFCARTPRPRPSFQVPRRFFLNRRSSPKLPPPPTNSPANIAIAVQILIERAAAFARLSLCCRI